jgi:CxxC-x17-CxxC domain-containing protein
MGNFNRDKKFGGGKGFKKSGGGSRGFSGGRPQMHQAVCSDCGNECEVPFRPSGDKPVYCNNCFGKHREQNTGRAGGKNFDRPKFSDKRMFKAICAKCGQECEVPFRPAEGKSVYCSQCFGKGDRVKSDNTQGKSSNQFKAEFEMLNNKLDKILRALNPVVETVVLPTAKPIKEVKEKKTSARTKVAPKKVVAKKKK